jgi:hypothetical protein
MENFKVKQEALLKDLIDFIISKADEEAAAKELGLSEKELIEMVFQKVPISHPVARYFGYHQRTVWVKE